MYGSLTLLRAASQCSYAPGVFNIEGLVCESIMHLSALKKARKHTLKTWQLVKFLVEHGHSLPPTKQSLVEPTWKSHGSLMETSHLVHH